jgi:hypothetical protein
MPPRSHPGPVTGPALRAAVDEHPASAPAQGHGWGLRCINCIEARIPSSGWGAL